MSESLEISIEMSPENSHLAAAVLTENHIEFALIDRKGFDGHADLITVLIAGTAMTIRAAVRLLETKIKKDSQTAVTFDGITIKGVSEKGIAEVIESVEKSRKTK